VKTYVTDVNTTGAPVERPAGTTGDVTGPDGTSGVPSGGPEGTIGDAGARPDGTVGDGARPEGTVGCA
jgi:hypothetical protein